MFVSIELDKVRNLKYGMRAFDIIENLTGKPVSKIDFENITMRTSAIMLYAGLVHEDKDLTIEKVMDLVDQYSNLNKVFPLIANAISLAIRGEVLSGSVGLNGEEKNA